MLYQLSYTPRRNLRPAAIAPESDLPGAMEGEPFIRRLSLRQAGHEARGRPIQQKPASDCI
jgi:hypothetical protein